MSSKPSHMGQEQEQPPSARGPPDVDERPIYDAIDYVYDQATEGDVAANDTIRGDDFTNRVSEFDPDTATNEVLEVFKIEMIPPVQATGDLHTVDTIRLTGDGDATQHLRYREFMLGFRSPDFHLSTPPLGVPVLSGVVNPQADPFVTSTPKFGVGTDISPELNNDGTAIDDSFTIRLHTFRWRGTDQELTDLFEAMYGRTTFPQNISMSNPFTGSRREYNRANPVRIQPGADGGSLGQFTKLTGGIDQELPKVWPWVTWSDNNQATTPNQFEKFDLQLDNVDESWKELEFDFTDQKKAAVFNYMMVNSPDELQDAQMVIAERDRDPVIKLPATSRHQLPTVYPMQGPDPTVPTNDERTAEDGALPASFGTTLDRAGREIGTDLLGGKQVIWDDGGGFRIRDNGNAIAANDVIIGVQGRRLELTS